MKPRSSTLLSSWQIRAIYNLTFCLLLLLSACKGGGSSKEAETRLHDSLDKVLNSPELKALNTQIVEQPSSPELYFRRASVYQTLKQVDAAEHDLKRCISLDTVNSKYYMALSDLYFSENKTRQAKHELELMEKKFPDDIECRIKLGELYFTVKDYQKAIDYTNKALELDPQDARAYFLKGNIYRESGDTARAISSLETAIEQNPHLSAAHHDLGIIFAARRNPVALQHYDNALKYEPNNRITLYARAKFYQDMGDFKKAADEYKQMIARDSSCAECFYNLGAMALDVDRDARKAAEFYTGAIHAAPEWVDAYYWRGFSYQQAGDKEKARNDYKKCLSIQPNYPPAVQSLNQL